MIRGIIGAARRGPTQEPTPGLPTTIGQEFGGGWYIGDIQDQGQHYKLLIAPKEAEASGLRWKTARSSTSGTSSTTDGRSNTLAMNSAEHEAASHCIAYRGAGYDDWYLPASEEIKLFLENISPLTTNVDEFKTGGAQELASGQYFWSSTQNGASQAWVQRVVGAAIQYSRYKEDMSAYTRPVRRIPFTP